MTATLSYKDRNWSRQPVAEELYRAWLDEFCGQMPLAKRLSDRILGHCAVRLRDIVDHIVLSRDHEIGAFVGAGWATARGVARINEQGMFPSLLEGEHDEVWLKVESIDRFLAANAIETSVDGDTNASLRKAIIAREGQRVLGVIERNGSSDFEVKNESESERRNARLATQALRARRREFDTVEQGIVHTEALVEAVVSDLGQHRACAAWLEAERGFWLSRCKAGRIAGRLKDEVGIGWANIDHFAYDGSREYYRQTITIFEKLGYELREMLYAGELAGWGSQILEQPVIGSTIFADVDLSPEELTVDFAHEALPALNSHRRAGVLAELLGEGILEAGPNHIAALYDQRLFRAIMANAGIGMMDPFTSFDHLYQELTDGELVAVDPRKIDHLEIEGHIGEQEAETLRLTGCIATHIENIERNDAYKGFNREGIDSVLRKLDPRGTKVFEE